MNLKIFNSPSLRTILVIWLVWSIGLIAFQNLVQARFHPQPPDSALLWTPRETLPHSQDHRPYLLDPFLNSQVAWDSEYYLSIATSGYDDPQVRSIPLPGGKRLSLNYAFMPLYPLLIRILAWPARLAGIEPIAAGTLVGVLVSVLGALGGMMGLYFLARDEFGEAGGIRAAFYLVIFPGGFFLAQVYTEGLFVGLAFGSLALIHQRRYAWAALLAVLATWTRAVGVALVIPLALPWIQGWLTPGWKEQLLARVSWKGVGRAVLHLSPLIAFIAWKFSPLGTAFNTVEENYFGRGFLAIATTVGSWGNAIQLIFSPSPPTAAYYVVELLTIVLGLTAALRLRKRRPGLAWFSLAVILLSLTSGPAQGMHRYFLGVPALFICLSEWGENPAFDRGWTLISTLLMALGAILFTFNFWAG